MDKTFRTKGKGGQAQQEYSFYVYMEVDSTEPGESTEGKGDAPFTMTWTSNGRRE